MVETTQKVSTRRKAGSVPSISSDWFYEKAKTEMLASKAEPGLTSQLRPGPDPAQH